MLSAIMIFTKSTIRETVLLMSNIVKIRNGCDIHKTMPVRVEIFLDKNVHHSRDIITNGRIIRNMKTVLNEISLLAFQEFIARKLYHGMLHSLQLHFMVKMIFKCNYFDLKSRIQITPAKVHYMLVNKCF